MALFCPIHSCPFLPALNLTKKLKISSQSDQLPASQSTSWKKGFEHYLCSVTHGKTYLNKIKNLKLKVVVQDGLYSKT